MQKINELMNNQAIPTNGTEQYFNSKEHEQYRVNSYNKSKGKLKGYDCSECNNRGDFAFLYDNNGYYEIMSKPCRCMKIRSSLQAIEKSGLSNVMKKLTFESFVATTDCQEYIKSRAKAFVKDDNIQWFYIGGQTGCGKTHICTAITIALFKQGKNGLYMLWRDKAAELKGFMNTVNYDEKIKELKKTEVLYIDDFLKTPNNKPPTSADINLAFEILNYRYINNLITIISSEWTLSDIINFDEATGSRIKELVGEYLLTVSKDKNRNQRKFKNGGVNNND